MPIVYLNGYRIHYKIKNENKIEQAEINPLLQTKVRSFPNGGAEIHPINDEAFDDEEFTR